ncbi:LacI family DNA-binding transcriptional regulator [Elioraea thermophila]|uniref:LacI family DNA-binding transcriptional regulator n=1 Tax=Elioraea thermophila TaxID=2185104 RepID=UPI000DF24C9E|nr:LacI family DNA-binding transcriptional regulator [Elioraea thermophila]
MSKDRAGSAEFLGLRDIAAHAGVSHMTVSRVIRRPETVAEPTRQRVLAAIEALGYVPNLAARDLVRGSSSFVCMVVSSLQNVFFAATVEGLVRGLDPLGLQVMLGDAGFSAEREARLVRGFVARRPAGVVLMGTDHAPETVRLLSRSRAPVVETWDLTRAPIGACVGFDNVAVGRLAARHFRAIGARRAVVLGRSTPRNRKRIAGFLAEAKEVGLAHARHVELADGHALRVGREALAGLLDQAADDRPDALFFVSDTLAIGALLEATRRGVAVPQEVAILGFGDHPLGPELTPSLSTITAPLEEMGHEAARLIAGALAGEDIRGRVFDLGLSLIARESTARAG